MKEEKITCIRCFQQDTDYYEIEDTNPRKRGLPPDTFKLCRKCGAAFIEWMKAGHQSSNKQS